MDTRDALLRVALLAELPQSELDAVEGEARVGRLGKRERVWSDGEPTGAFAFVLDGRIKLVHTLESGREVILDFVEPGGLLCGSAVYCGDSYCCSALVNGEGAEVLHLPRETVMRLAERYPAVARAFMTSITCRGQALCRRVGEVASGKVEQRIAVLLLRLADHVGEPRDDGTTWIPVHLSRQDLADLCGTTIESAIRTMSRFAREELVETTDGGFVVRGGGRLRSVAGGNLQTVS